MGSEKAVAGSNKEEAVKSLEVAKQIWDAKPLGDPTFKTSTYYANAVGQTVSYNAADLGYKG